MVSNTTSNEHDESRPYSGGRNLINASEGLTGQRKTDLNGTSRVIKIGLVSGRSSVRSRLPAPVEGTAAARRTTCMWGSGRAMQDPPSCGYDSCLPDLRLDLLQTFLAVAQEGNVARASRRLFLTQQRALRRIRALERRLGVPLLSSTVPVQLTDQGRALLPHVETMVAAAHCLLAAPGPRMTSGSRHAWD